MCFIQRHEDPLVFVLKHDGTGKQYFKVENEQQLVRSEITLYRCTMLYAQCNYSMYDASRGDLKGEGGDTGSNIVACMCCSARV